MTGAAILSKLASMKLSIPAVALVLLAACNASSSQNTAQGNVQEVAANNMSLDEVTEVQDDSASALPNEGEGRERANNSDEKAPLAR